MPWPVDIVISSECQKIYNQVFLLLLQIKWAKYSLDTLRFSGEASHRMYTRRDFLFISSLWCLFLLDLTDATRKVEEGSAEEVKGKEPIKEQVHRMCLLRVKLMHFVNSLHNYIMTRVS